MHQSAHEMQRMRFRSSASEIQMNRNEITKKSYFKHVTQKAVLALNRPNLTASIRTYYHENYQVGRCSAHY